ncbi:hypothetical protein ACIP2X_18930 [Streptomyces sp. NPDC089424]|uniref:hypothetical protein n=1 Tax=Streptomyces sp. NPDC089424 TaxID=3365917 RepID=UPI00380DCCE4
MKKHPVGTRVRITIALDPQQYPVGTEATVTGYSWTGFPQVTLDDGPTVTLIPGQLLPA